MRRRGGDDGEKEEKMKVFDRIEFDVHFVFFENDDFGTTKPCVSIWEDNLNPNVRKVFIVGCNRECSSWENSSSWANCVSGKMSKYYPAYAEKFLKIKVPPQAGEGE